MWDQTPPELVEYSLACFWVLADDPVLLARGSIVVSFQVRGFDKARDYETKLVRRRFLSEASAHYLKALWTFCGSGRRDPPTRTVLQKLQCPNISQRNNWIYAQDDVSAVLALHALITRRSRGSSFVSTTSDLGRVCRPRAVQGRRYQENSLQAAGMQQEKARGLSTRTSQLR